MARIRTIKPGFFRSLSVAELPKATRLTWIGLWTYVDDDGRGVDDSRLIKAELWPLDDDYTAKDVETDMELLEASGSIRRYVVEGRRYFVVVKWRDHQRIDKPTRSILPEPPSTEERARNEDSPSPPGILAEASLQEGNREREEGIGNGLAALKAPRPRKAPSTAKDSPATAVVRAWWESHDPRPPNNFIGVVKVVERLLASGVDPRALRQALDDAPTPTLNALQVALGRQLTPASTTGRISTDRDGPSIAWIPEDAT